MLPHEIFQSGHGWRLYCADVSPPSGSVSPESWTNNTSPTVSWEELRTQIWQKAKYCIDWTSSATPWFDIPSPAASPQAAIPSTARVWRTVCIKLASGEWMPWDIRAPVWTGRITRIRRRRLPASPSRIRRPWPESSGSTPRLQTKKIGHYLTAGS